MMRTVLIGSLLVCSACAAGPYQAYSGPPLPPGEQARILVLVDSARQNMPGGAPALGIGCVDGESTNKNLLSNHYPMEAFVEPGRHYLGVLFSHMNSSGTVSLWLDAEAGRTYTVHAALRGYAIRFWLTDTSTGRPVGGIVGRGMTPAPGARTCG